MKNLSRHILSISCLAFALSACSTDEKNADIETDSSTQSYTIKIINLSNNQPMSPPAAILHSADFSAWAIGSTASSALEKLAEGGDSSDFLALQNNNPQFSASSALKPGDNVTFTLTSNDFSKLTIATMLINTNDAFSGINAVELSQLQRGQTLHINGMVYDAGTENNLELDDTMPGQGGEGYNANNDDVTKRVTMHGGVVTADDGYADSVLNQSHKFGNIAMSVSITAL